MNKIVCKKFRIIQKICTATLAVLHIFTFGPTAEVLAYTATSANFKLNSGTTIDGTYSRGSVSYKLTLEAIGETSTGKIQSASYQLRSGFVYNVESNPPQFIGPIPNQSWPKNEALQNAFDLDNYFQSEYSLAYTVFGNSPISVSIDPQTHAVSFSQADGYYGTKTVYFTATDIEGNTVRSNDIVLQVLNVNNPPVLEPIPDITAKEGELITITPHATDTDGDPITYSFSSPFNSSGQWQSGFHDGDGGSRTYTITVTAADKDGSTSRSVNVTVLNVNRPPVIQPMADIIKNENELVRITPQVTDEDAEPINIWYSTPFNSSGSWLAGYDDAGRYTVTVSASDGIDTVSRSVNVIIQNVNRPPAATLSLSSSTLKPNEQCQITLSASDPDGDSMSFVLKKDGIAIASGVISSSYTMAVSFSIIGDHAIEATVTDNGTPQSLSSAVTKGLNVIDPNADRDAITPVAGDFNGDCLTDIGFYDINTGSWNIAISNKGVFDNTVLWLSNFGTSRDWIPISGDFNGDGITDIGVYNNTTGSDGGKCQIGLSSGSTFTTSGEWTQFSDSSYDWQPITGDFNIDKYTDLGLYNKKTGEVKIAFSDGSSFGNFTSWVTGFGGDGHTILTGDFNGDGLPDVCTFKESQGEWKVALNNTNGFVDSSIWINNFAQNKTPIVADFNNDGLTDIGYWDKNTGDWYYAISTGNGFVNKGIWCSGFGTNSDEYAYTGDFNGDGITTPAIFDKDKDGLLKWNTDFSDSSFSDEPQKTDLLVKINNGTGGIIEITYDFAANYTDNTLPFPLYVAKTITLIDTLPSESEPELYGQYISYEGGYYDANDREFRGFAKVTVRDPVTENYTETYFYQGKPGQNAALKGKIEKLIAYEANGQKISQVLNSWEVRDAGPSGKGLGFPYLKEVETTVWEQNRSYITTRTKFSYDNLGNLIKALNEGDIADTGDEKIAQTVFSPAYEEGRNRPVVVFLKDGSENILTKKNFEYDTKGNLIKETAWLNTEPDNSPYSLYSYNSYGNVVSMRNPNGAYVYTSYESSYYTFPETVTNELGHTIQYKYNVAFGAVEELTDTNGNKTTSVYDTFGRIIRQKNPDGEIVTSYSYPDFNTKITHQLNLTTTEYADGLGRVYKSKTSGEDGGLRRDVVKEVSYNNRGLIDYETLPYYAGDEPKSFIRYSYDKRGRLISATADYEGIAQDATSYVNYISPLITESINAKGQKKTTVKDVYGNVIEVIEYNGSTGIYHTYYKYDLQGNLKEVIDAQNNRTHINYDSLGRKLSMQDPDMGRWSYAYDKMGNLISQTDAKSQTITFTYDTINRLTAKSIPSPQRGEGQGEGVITYTYDQGTNSTGRLTKVTDANGYITTYNYDKEGRITSSTGTIDDVSYQTSTAYDILGRIKSVTYPDSETVSYTYDTNSGYLESLRGEATSSLRGEATSSLRGEAEAISYIQNITYNATGQIKDISYGNSTKTVYTYRPDHKLQNIKTLGADGLAAIQDLAYEFDKASNITKYADNLRGNIREFSYDDLNRLIEARNIPDPQGGYTTQTFQYDAIGNMTYNSSIGFMSYGQGAGPHAVTTAGGYSYQYDVNGNQTYGRGRRMEYDVENRLTKVITAAGTTEFKYDADGKRIKKLSSSETAIYISASYEVRTTSVGAASGGEQKIIKHIFTGSDRSITVEKTNGQTHTYYCHNDHLGSTNIITDENGFLVQQCEYTPFGELASNTGTYNSPYKFTSKELDDFSGLYYYGARYYDAVLCHFVQADTIVPQPLNPQSFNRYSYCDNNPINYTDPTGHSSWSKFWDKVEDFFKDGGGAILAGIAVAALTAWAIGPAIGAISHAFALSGAGTTFMEGFIIGALEMGIPAFTGTLAGGVASGQKFDTALKNAAIVGGITALTAGVIEGAYAEGWQDIIHFRDVRQDEVNYLNKLIKDGNLTLANEMLTNLTKKYDMVLVGVKQFGPGGIPVHPDIYASTTSGHSAGVGFDFAPKTTENYLKVLAGQKVDGVFSARNLAGITKMRYDLLVLKSSDPTIVNKAIPIIEGRIGQHHYYQMYGEGAYNCQHGCGEILSEIGLQ